MENYSQTGDLNYSHTGSTKSNRALCGYNVLRIIKGCQILGKTPNCTKLKVQKNNNHTNKLHRNLLIKGCIYRVHLVYQFTILYIHLVYFCILCMILAYLRSVQHMFCILLHSLHTLVYIAKFLIYIYIFFFILGMF